MGQQVTSPHQQQQQPHPQLPVSQPASAAATSDLLGHLAALGLTPQQTQQVSSVGVQKAGVQPVVSQAHRAPPGTVGGGPGSKGDQPDPLAVLNDLFVPQESIQPGWWSV